MARFYVWVIRGTPLLVQLFVIFYGLPSLGILLDAFPAALIGLGASIAPDTAQASTPKMDRPMSSAKNRRRQYVAGDPFPRRLLIVLSPIR